VASVAKKAGGSSPSPSPHTSTSTKTKTKTKTTKTKTAKTAKTAKTSKKSSKKAKAKHTTGVHRADNMPANWVWPPSRPMIAAGAQCLAKLDELGVEYERAEAQDKIVTPIVVPGMKLGGLELDSLWRKGPFVMDCELALALETYGPQLAEAGVRKLIFSRIWGNTLVRVGGVTKPYLSRHALGLAIDVYAFVDEAGNKSVVETAYPQGDPFLVSIEDTVNASGGFRLCLTPKNDPISHHDHFHLEAAVVYPTPPTPRVSQRDDTPKHASRH